MQRTKHTMLNPQFMPHVVPGLMLNLCLASRGGNLGGVFSYRGNVKG